MAFGIRYTDTHSVLYDYGAWIPTSLSLQRFLHKDRLCNEYGAGTHQFIPADYVRQV